MTAYLVDNSLWARYQQNDPAATLRIGEVVASPSDRLVTCPPTVLEYCHSAPVGKYEEYLEFVQLGFPLEKHPEEFDVVEIQRALWDNGLARSAKAMDILIAAYAIKNDAVVLSCDHDYEYIAKVTPLRQEYIAPSTPLPEANNG
jgi:predicted nucleic acid-binding protein